MEERLRVSTNVSGSDPIWWTLGLGNSKCCEGTFVLHRTAIIERGVTPLMIVPDVDVTDEITVRGRARGPARAGHQFGLQCREETLHDGVVPTITRPTHATAQAVV